MPDAPPPTDPEQPQPPPSSTLKERAGFIYLLSKGMVRDQTMRRNVMMWLVMSAVGVLFIGAVFLDGFLREHIILFALYWLACAWLTLCAVLLAIFDILVQFAKGRASRKALTKDVLMKELERLQRERAAGKE
jgi:hypothetical protein